MRLQPSPLPSGRSPAAAPPRCEGSGVVGCYEPGRRRRAARRGPALTRALDGARREGRRGGEGTAPGRGPAGPCGRAAERLCVSLLGRGCGARVRRRGRGGDGPARPCPAVGDRLRGVFKFKLVL